MSNKFKYTLAAAGIAGVASILGASYAVGRSAPSDTKPDSAVLLGRLERRYEQ